MGKSNAKRQMWREAIEFATVGKVVAIDRIISTLSITAMNTPNPNPLQKRSRLRPRTVVGILIAAGTALTVVGCVRQSGKVVYFHEAELPKGWPLLTEVGVVEVKEYPQYREAVVTKNDGAGSDEKMGPMFGTLFNHISKNDIPMTAPVEMEYSQKDARAMTSMAFLYRTSETGTLGNDGQVVVREVAPRTYASVGVRGSYNDDNFASGLAIVNAWLAANPQWRADGTPRFFGYNSPFILWFWKYGEVQVPVVESAKTSA